MSPNVFSTNMIPDTASLSDTVGFELVGADLGKDVGRALKTAIALYNSYGFGYALGMNFKNPQGRREMLWPEDLDEILSTGETKKGCRIR